MDKEYRVSSLEYVYLGRSGENLARTVRIDVSEWLDRWPGASIHILHRPKGSEGYYIADTTLEGGMLTWVITAADVAAPGRGRLEIRATEGETIKKSMIGVSIVDASLTGNETEPPDPQSPWVDSVLAAAATVETSAERAEQAADRAEQASAKGVLTVNGIGPDENGNVEIDTTGGGGGTGSYYTPSISASGELSWTPSSAGMPAVPPANITGPKGDTGPAGQNGVSATHSWAGTTLTVTSASGTSSADLKGDTGAQGPAGADGYTPVKGVDYYTEADKTELVQAVLNALPAAEGVSY